MAILISYQTCEHVKCNICNYQTRYWILSDLEIDKYVLRYKCFLHSIIKKRFDYSCLAKLINDIVWKENNHFPGEKRFDRQIDQIVFEVENNIIKELHRKFPKLGRAKQSWLGYNSEPTKIRIKKSPTKIALKNF